MRELLRYAADDVIPLNGTGYGESDKGVMLALASFGGHPCVQMATELGLPLVTVIDTPGADLARSRT